MLELKHINVSFNNHHVLKELSCTVDTGDFVVIVGANGAGKSTFFDTIAGKTIPNAGTITIDGKDVTSLTEEQRASIVTRLFQNTQLNSVGSLTVHQNLAIALYSRRSARLVDGMQSMSRAQAEKIVQNLGMDISILDKQMNSLSGGQRQLIAFAMATLMIPKVLLLDEPTAALDPQAATRLLTYAARFIKEHTITTLLITHDPHIALSLGNKIWILEQGHITKQYGKQDKSSLDPNKLIGQIDYKQLAL